MTKTDVCAGTPAPTGDQQLGASTEWPRVVLRDRDVEMGNIEKLAVEYPEAAADLRTFPLPAKPKG